MKLKSTAGRRGGRVADADRADHDAMLLATARKLFFQFGFEGTSIETVARAARVSPKTIYGRYGGKDGLFAASIRERLNSVLPALDVTVRSQSDLRAALTTFAERLLAVTMRPEALIVRRIVIAESARFPELARAFNDAGPNAAATTVAAFFKRATDLRLFNAADPLLAAEMFTGALLDAPLRRATYDRRPLTQAELARHAQSVVALFLGGFVETQPARKPSSPGPGRSA